MRKAGRTMSKKTRIIAVDDFRISREFLRLDVMSSSENEFVGAFSSADEAVAFCDANDVDIVIMDIMMRVGTDGLTAAGQIKKKHPKIKIILVTSAAESDWERKAREIGVEGFWYKEYSPEPLEQLIRSVANGGICYPEVKLNLTFGQTAKVELTDRERDILRELICGYTNDEIAKNLGITVNTVKYHVKNLLSKTGYENRLSLAVNAKTLGIVVSDIDRRGQ